MPSNNEVGLKIVENARRYVGLTEIRPNAEWDDLSTPGPDDRGQEIRRLLLSTKWPLGAAYCIAFAEAVIIKSYKELNAPQDFVEHLSNKFTPSVVVSYRNLVAGRSSIPSIGSVVFWEKGRSGLGHAAIVEQLKPNGLITIEGNTSRGSTSTLEKQRNGDGIYERERPIGDMGAMRLLGFWNPIGW